MSEENNRELEVEGEEAPELHDGSSEEEEEEEEGSDPPCVPPEELLAQGKKFLAAGDATAALDSLQEVCTLLAEEHGQMSRELAEPYYLYGRALLEVAREKSAVFGQGVPGGGDGGGSSGDGGGRSGDGGGSSDGCNSEGGPGSNSTPSSACATSSGDGGGDVPDLPGASSDGPDAGTQGPQGGEEEEEEEESDLQLAWEVLELARVICQRETDRDYKLKLSDVNLALGEVGLESDQYEQAITDLQSSLQLREFVLEPTDRRIAEVHFNLGLAYTLAKQAQQAITAYQSSKTTLSRRRDYLQEEVTTSTADSDSDLQDEIKELEELIKDIDCKVVDAQELKKVLEDQESLGQNASGSEVECCSAFDKPSDDIPQVSESTLKMKGPANDISHLVRKRKPESAEAKEGDVAAVKRVHLESNGISNISDDSATTTHSQQQQLDMPLEQ